MIQQKKLFFLQDALVEILKPLADAGFASFRVNSVEKAVGIYFQIVIL